MKVLYTVITGIPKACEDIISTFEMGATSLPRYLTIYTANQVNKSR